MKQFLMLIRTEGDHMATLNPDEQQAHVEKVGNYIRNLVQKGKLQSAQPLEMDGTIIASPKGKLKDGPFNETKEIVAGYFLVEASNMEEAVEMAKANPVLDDENARIEIRPIKNLQGIN